MLLKPKEGASAAAVSSSHDHGTPVDVRGRHKSRAQQGPWTWRPWTLLTTAVAVFSLAVIVWSSLKLQLDPQGCVMSMMSPTYIKLSGFDTEHSRFASKYSLYLYREEGVDEYTQDNIGLRGAPVLFIPGNAGSYKQIRSLSSEASRYYHDFLREDTAARAGVRSMDFFTLDFNEDLAAFHGQTLIDQAEYVNEAVAYILSLYAEAHRLNRDPSLPDPTSVILIGHSMGGVVARTVLVTPKYQANSVNTIITMSTPHARPPVSFDADMVSVYQQINDYWRESYNQDRDSNNPLLQTTLISIAGGGRDTTVPSDYCSISSLVPETHGFTVFTSTIPHVWTSMDHLAITWADQVRKTIVKSLYEIVDVRRTGQTKSRSERMRIFRKWFLTGLEDSTPRLLPSTEHEVLLTLGNGPRSSINKSNSFAIKNFGMQDETSVKLLRIPAIANESDKRRLSLLTNQMVDNHGSLAKADVLLCSTFPLPDHSASVPIDVRIDLSDGDPSATRLACKKALGDAVTLPASTRSSRYAFDQIEPFTYLQYDIADLQGYQFLAVVDKTTEISDKWLYVEVASLEEGVITVASSLPHLLLRGVNQELPPSRPLMTEIKIPAVNSGLLGYHLKIRQHGCDQDAELFTPLLRQYIDSPYESKYFVNFKEGDISLHGVAPFMPPPLNGKASDQGVSFQIWSDPTCNSSIEFRLRPDWLGSLGKLVIRYRTVLAAFPLLVVAMVLRKQFRIYDNTGVFISFTDSLDQSLRLSLPILLLSMTLFATAFTNAGLGRARDIPVAGNITINFQQNDLLLGSQDNFFWFLVPLCGLVSIGTCVLLNYLVLGLLHALDLATAFYPRSKRYVKIDDSQKGFAPVFVARTPRRRVINTILLVSLVATVIPYPFAYVVACLVQLATCTRALRYTRGARSGAALNFFNYTHSILILMLWVLPINLPVLVVWVHNLAVHWLTPFSSHHNVLSILPFILLVETLTSGSMVPAMKKFKWTTNVLFFTLAVYAAVYGMTYAYRLHYIANIIALWLVLLHFVAHRIRVSP